MDEKTSLIIKFISSFLLSFIVSIITNKIIIKIFKKYKLKQVEREYLSTHQIKEGTPSLGGLAVLLSTLISFFIFSTSLEYKRKFIVIIFGFIFFSLVGLYDDLSKIIKKKSDGISGKKRLFLETLIVLYMLVILKFHVVDFFDTKIKIFSSSLYLGPIFIPFIIFLIVGSANSVNLSDGLDGLSSGLILIALLPFLFFAFHSFDILLIIFLLCLIGSILGFMMFNLHPAKIFMGDTGSLSLGASLALISIYLDKVYILPICAFIFIIETLSVIIQVLYYKKTHKRVFLMTPLHHHFEKKGIKEYRIVSYFWLFGIIFSLISLIGGLL